MIQVKMNYESIIKQFKIFNRNVNDIKNWQKNMRHI